MKKAILGVLIGIVLGYYIPPGLIFWTIVGGIAGYLMHRYSTLE